MTHRIQTLRAGLTGGIGSGKSTVADMFRRLGIPIIDADQISHDLTTPQGAALPLIRAQFKNSVFDADGLLSRARLRALIFENPAAKQQLEHILHPLIQTEALKQFHQHAQSAHIVIFDIPLLAESPYWRAQLDRILVIDCSAETQIQRVMARSNWSREHIQTAIAQQATREKRLSIATDVIVNDGIAFDVLAQKVHHLLNTWELLSAKR